MSTRIFACLLLCSISITVAYSQEQGSFGNKPLKWYLNADSTHWLKFHTYIQLWARATQNNPGTVVLEDPEDHTLDLSIRRFRFALQGQLRPKLFVYTQLGINNLNYISPRGTSVDLLDAYAEYQLDPTFEFGGGKTAWTGLSRYSAPNTSMLLTYDLSFLPLPTNNETNDLIRKLSIYVKGKLSQLDYRLVLSKPFAARNSSNFDPVPKEGLAQFTDQANSRLYSGYIKWEFWEKESNRIPFSDGSYLGKRTILNVGLGLEYQPKALWSLSQGDTLYHNMVLWAADMFLDMPLNQQKNTAITFYTGYFNYDFGPNFLRSFGADNPAREVIPELASFNGPGNAFPTVGSGQSLLAQFGFLLPRMGMNGRLGQLQPYTALQYSDFDRLDEPVIVVDLGINWFLQEHFSKLSLNLQSRPIFYESSDKITTDDRRWMMILQYLIRME